MSKICVVGPPKCDGEEVDVDFTFAAVGVRDGDVDFSSNCGNMSAAVGPFASDHGLVPEGEGGGKVSVRIRNTNSGKVIVASFGVGGGEALARGEFAIDGVEGTGARVRLDFLDPA